MAEASGGELVAGSPAIPITRVSTDSRKTQPGDLFVALAGERFDGHEYVRQVSEKGAAAVLVDRAKLSPPLPDCAVIAVDNTRQALGRLGARYRRDFDLPIVAVGGSNGKTTTKELLASVLRQRFKTLWSEASFNNEIGVPVTLLDLDRSHHVA
ncbi:MAG TPA: Mur ligase domain-containing protein, partial [Verrucomicrobiae bacterium]|nr:Mur ligase domain-containing protein [Verrucomicrobiae bacterium]